MYLTTLKWKIGQLQPWVALNKTISLILPTLLRYKGSLFHEGSPDGLLAHFPFYTYLILRKQPKCLLDPKQTDECLLDHEKKQFNID